jgi:hypothetical protein
MDSPHYLLLLFFSSVPTAAADWYMVCVAMAISQ